MKKPPESFSPKYRAITRFNRKEETAPKILTIKAIDESLTNSLS